MAIISTLLLKQADQGRMVLPHSDHLFSTEVCIGMAETCSNRSIRAIAFEGFRLGPKTNTMSQSHLHIGSNHICIIPRFQIPRHKHEIVDKESDYFVDDSIRHIDNFSGALIPWSVPNDAVNNQECTYDTVQFWPYLHRVVTCYAISSAMKIFTYGCDMLW